MMIVPLAADQAGDVLRVRHRRGQHHRVALRILGHQVERVRHFALVLEDIDAAAGHDLVGNCGSGQQMFSGAATWKNRSVAMPPE